MPLQLDYLERGGVGVSAGECLYSDCLEHETSLLIRTNTHGCPGIVMAERGALATTMPGCGAGDPRSWSLAPHALGRRRTPGRGGPDLRAGRRSAEQADRDGQPVGGPAEQGLARAVMVATVTGRRTLAGCIGLPVGEVWTARVDGAAGEPRRARLTTGRYQPGRFAMSAASADITVASSHAIEPGALRGVAVPPRYAARRSA